MTIKEARKKAGLSQAKAAAFLKIPNRTLENWEAGMRQPPQYIEDYVIETLLSLKPLPFVEIIPGGSSLEYRGFIFDRNSDRMIDERFFKELELRRGENYVENLKDSFYDGCFEPICQGIDGKLYAVLFEFDNDQRVPCIWRAVLKVK